MSSVLVISFLPTFSYVSLVKHIEKFIFIHFVLIENVNINHKHHQTVKTFQSNQNQSWLTKLPIDSNYSSFDDLFSKLWIYSIIFHCLSISQLFWIDSSVITNWNLLSIRFIIYIQQSKEENMFSLFTKHIHLCYSFHLMPLLKVLWVFLLFIMFERDKLCSLL
jgi:hypothetical protein